MKMNVLLGIGILIGAVGAAQATVITSAVNGAWTNGATWGGGSVPGNGDGAVVNHAVSLSSSASVGGYVNVAAGGNGTLTLNNGAVLNSVSNSTLASANRTGATVINSGAVWTNAGRVLVCSGSGASGTMTLNGGKYVGSGTGTLLLGDKPFSNFNARVVLTNGASWVQQSYVQIQSTNVGTQTAYIDIYANSLMQASYILAATNTGTALSQGVNVRGGDLILTQAAEGSALQGAAKIYFDAGTIKFTGVDSLADYNTFTNSWNTWVDNGMITSTAGYTAEELKGALSFDGADAIATIQPRLRTIKLIIIR